MIGFVVTLRDVGLGVVLLDPRQDMFGVKRNAITPADASPSQLKADQPDRIGEQKLQDFVWDLAQHAGQVAFGWQAGV